jgi:glutamine synthetase
MVIKPCSMFKDPLRMGNHKLVLCDAWELDDTPLPGNTRHYCKRVLEKCADLEPIFGIEQEYTLLNAKTFRPLGWPKEYGFPAQQGPYYCGNGAGM